MGNFSSQLSRSSLNRRCLIGFRRRSGSLRFIALGLLEEDGGVAGTLCCDGVMLCNSTPGDADSDIEGLRPSLGALHLVRNLVIACICCGLKLGRGGQQLRLNLRG